MLGQIGLGVRARRQTAHVVRRELPEIVVVDGLVPRLPQIRIHGREPPLRPLRVLADEKPAVEPEGRAVCVEMQELRTAHRVCVGCFWLCVIFHVLSPPWWPGLVGVGFCCGRVRGLDYPYRSYTALVEGEGWVACEQKADPECLLVACRDVSVGDSGMKACASFILRTMHHLVHAHLARSWVSVTSVEAADEQHRYEMLPFIDLDITDLALLCRWTLIIV